MVDLQARRTRSAISGFLLAAAVFLLSLAALEFGRVTGRVAAIWPVNAVAVAVFLRTSPRRWAGLGLAALGGCCAANLAAGDGLPLALGLSAANGVEVAICAGLARWLAGAEPDLTRIQDLVRFTGAALVAPLASSVVSLLALTHAGHHYRLQNLVEWYSVDALGLLIVTPPLMTVTRARALSLARRVRTGRGFGAVAALLAALAATYGQQQFPLLFVVMPALLLCAVQLGVLGAALGILLAAVVAVVATLTGHGPAMLMRGNIVDRLHELQGFLLLQTLAVLPVSAVLAGRRRMEATLKASLAAAEEAARRLEDSEARYRLLAEASSDLVIKVDQNDAIQYVSPSVCRYGYEPERLIGVTGFSLVHPDDKVKLSGLIDELFSGPDADPDRDRTYRLRTAAGNWVWFEGKPTVIRDAAGVAVAVVSQLRDISDRVAATQRLAESEARYRLLANNSTDVIGCYGDDGVFTYLSPSIRGLMGYEAEEMIGKPIPGFMHPDDVKPVLRLFRDYLARGPSARPIRFAYRAFRKDGQMVWLEAHPRAIYDEAGNFVEFQDVVRDITARVRMEDNMRRAQADAEAAMAAKSQFLANMSHEIRTPLTAILGFAGLLAERGKLDELGAQHLERVRTAGQSLLSIVNDILDFSKLEAGGVELKPRPVRLTEAVHEILLMFAPQAAARGLALEFIDAEDLPAWVEVDLDRLRQVLFNLLGNALKFTEAGSVSLRLGYDHPGARVRIAVADTGPGIAPEDQQRLFQRFQQVDDSSTRRHGGTGLGLAISKGLVAAMGGEISLTSQPGAGSTFAFEIVAPVCDAPANLPSVAAGPPMLDGLRVLVVDDNLANREIAQAILLATGAEVTLAEDGTEAVSAAAETPFDVILMDRRMPGMDGVEALRRIRQTPGPNDNVPVLAFSADTQAYDDADAEGFDGVVQKPIVPDDLLAAVDRATRWTAGAEPRGAPDADAA